MAPLLYDLGSIAVYIFILTSMFLTGLMVTIGELVAPLHNRRLLTFSLFANFILVPLIAITLIVIIPMNPELAAGLLLVSIAAGAPSTGKVAQYTGGNVGQAVSLSIIMTIVTIVLIPFLIPFILNGARTDSLYVMGNLVVLILIPILLGIAVRNRSEPLSARLEPVMDWASDISILVIFLTFGVIFFSRFGNIVSTGSGALAVFVAIFFTLAVIGITYLIGRFEGNAGVDLALGAGFRNITAVLVVIFASLTNIQKDSRVGIFAELHGHSKRCSPHGAHGHRLFHHYRLNSRRDPLQEAKGRREKTKDIHCLNWYCDLSPYSPCYPRRGCRPKEKNEDSQGGDTSSSLLEPRGGPAGQPLSPPSSYQCFVFHSITKGILQSVAFLY